MPELDPFELEKLLYYIHLANAFRHIQYGGADPKGHFRAGRVYVAALAEARLLKLRKGKWRFSKGEENWEALREFHEQQYANSLLAFLPGGLEHALELVGKASRTTDKIAETIQGQWRGLNLPIDIRFRYSI